MACCIARPSPRNFRLPPQFVWVAPSEFFLHFSRLHPASHSYSLTFVHLMETLTMSLDNTLNHLRIKHNRASPNTCAACRARKVRCDGRRTVCTNCERLGFTCSFEKSQTNGVSSPVVPISRASGLFSLSLEKGSL